MPRKIIDARKVFIPKKLKHTRTWKPSKELERKIFQKIFPQDLNQNNSNQEICKLRNPEVNYIAYFSFFKPKNGYQGHFNMIVRAKDPEEAVEKYEKELLSLHENDESGALVGVNEIYLDSIIEISKFPDSPVITNFREQQTIETGIIGCDLINPTQHIKNYGWSPDDEEPDPEADSETIEPFMKFETE